MAAVKSAGRPRAAKRSGTRASLAAQQQVMAVDIQQFLNSFKLPGVDLKSIVDSGRADIRGVALANRRAYESMQSLARRQGEMLREAAADWRVAVKGLAAVDADELLAQRTALARQVIRETLARVRALAEACTANRPA